MKARCKMEKSPVIKSKPQELTFPEAIKSLIEGKRISRVSWGDVPDYGLMKDGYLMICRNGNFFRWVVSESDMVGVDWIVLATTN